jgi:hypothetical protein
MIGSELAPPSPGGLFLELQNCVTGRMLYVENSASVLLITPSTLFARRWSVTRAGLLANGPSLKIIVGV